MYYPVCTVLYCLYCAGVCLVCYSLIGYSAYRCQSRMVQLTTVTAVNPNLNKVIMAPVHFSSPILTQHNSIQSHLFWIYDLLDFKSKKSEFHGYQKVFY